MVTRIENKYRGAAELVRSLYRAHTCTIHIYSAREADFPEYVTVGDQSGSAAGADLVAAAEETLDQNGSEPNAPVPIADTLVAPLVDADSGERLGHLFVTGADGAHDHTDLPATISDVATQLIDHIGTSIAHDRTLLRAHHDGRYAHVRLREANHRMKNALQTVESLLSLQAGTHTEEPVCGALREAAERVRAIHLLYDRLTYCDGTDGVSLSLQHYLTALVESFEDAYCTVQPVAWHVEIDDVSLSAERLSSIGLIVNEVISNALIHAFGKAPGCNDESSTAPTIRVSAARDVALLTIRVADNGVGVPPGFEPGESVGLGTTIVRLLTERLDGSLTYERRASGGERGTVVSIAIPLDRTNA